MAKICAAYPEDDSIGEHVSPVILWNGSLKERVACPVRVYLAGLRSPRSRTTMRESLRVVLRVSTGVDAAPEAFPWSSLTFAHMVAMRMALTDHSRAYSPATINKAMAAVRGVARAAWRLGLIDSDTFARIADVKGVRNDRLSPGRSLSVNEIGRLYAACDESPVGVRNRAVLSVLFYGGLRRSELSHLDVDCWNPETGELRVLIAKDDIQRALFIKGGARQDIDKWMACRSSLGQMTVRNREPLFLSSRNGVILRRRLGSPAIAALLGRIAKRAKVAKFSPHDCRRTAMSEMLRVGVDLSTVQRFAGHKSPLTTVRYDKRGQDALEKAAEAVAKNRDVG